MTKEEILNYVAETPQNTNRAVLSDMLDEYSSGDSNAVLTVTINPTWHNCDKTYREIATTAATGVVVFLVATEGNGNDVYQLASYFYSSEENVYVVIATLGSTMMRFEADSETDTLWAV